MKKGKASAAITEPGIVIGRAAHFDRAASENATHEGTPMRGGALGAAAAREKGNYRSARGVIAEF